MDKQDNTVSVKDPLNTSYIIASLTLINSSLDVEPAGGGIISSPGASLSTENLTSIHQQYVARQQIHSQPIAQVEHWHAIPQSKPPQTWQVKLPITSFADRESELGQLDDEGELRIDSSIHQMMSCKTPGITFFSLLSQLNTLSGLSGVGQPETARQYAHYCAKHYDHHAIEINTENASTLSDSCRESASKSHLPTTDEQGALNAKQAETMSNRATVDCGRIK